MEGFMFTEFYLQAHEKESVLIEITELMATEIANDFEVNQVIIKAPPDEPEKVNAVVKNSFTPYVLKDFSYPHYYTKFITAV